jgi:hypothetical protein
VSSVLRFLRSILNYWFEKSENGLLKFRQPAVLVLMMN